MTEKEPIRSEVELAEAFDQLFNEIPSPQTQEEIDKYISDAGIDPDSFSLKIKKMVADAIEKSSLNWRNEANQTKIEKARTQLESIRDISEFDHSKLVSIVENAFARIKMANPQFSSIHYRNHSELSDEDLKSLLQELIYIADNENINIDLGN